MLSVFIAIPIVFHPTVELVKRDMQMLFLYLFLLGNMGFLTTYTGLIKGGVAYSLDSCIYLNVAIVIGGIFFFRMWEKIPPDVDIKRLVIKRLGRKCFILLKIYFYIKYNHIAFMVFPPSILFSNSLLLLSSGPTPFCLSLENKQASKG